MLTGIVVKVGEHYVTLTLKEARELKEVLSRFVPDEQLSEGDTGTTWKKVDWNKVWVGLPLPPIDERVWREFPNNHMSE